MTGHEAGLFRALADRSADAVVLVDAAHRITYMNRAAADLFATTPASVLGESLHELLTPAIRDEHRDRLQALWREGATGEYRDNVSYELTGLRADGTEFPASLSVLNLTDMASPGLGLIIRDRTPVIEYERNWARLADTDPLTGLLNRRAFLTSAEAMAAATERRGDAFSILLVDIDNFKTVNDTYGHAVGDEVLKAVVERTQQSLRDGDLLGRWGGEELVAALSEVDQYDATAPGERLCARMTGEPVTVPSLAASIPVTVSVGITISTRPAGRLEALIGCADAALYRAKHSGRNCVRLEVDGQCYPHQHHGAD